MTKGLTRCWQLCHLGRGVACSSSSSSPANCSLRLAWTSSETEIVSSTTRCHDVFRHLFLNCQCMRWILFLLVVCSTLLLMIWSLISLFVRPWDYRVQVLKLFRQRRLRMNCILQDLFRDTPFDHIWCAHIRVPNTIFGVFQSKVMTKSHFWLISPL